MHVLGTVLIWWSVAAIPTSLAAGTFLSFQNKR